MTGKGAELVGVCCRRKIDILCVQETRWGGSKARELGLGYKLIYHGESTKRNGVGVIVSENIKSNVIEVKRVSDRLMIVRLAFGKAVVNVVSAYAPQMGCTDDEKEKFWESLENKLQSIPSEERIIMGADLNGRVGRSRNNYERVHGGYGYGECNEE